MHLMVDAALNTFSAMEQMIAEYGGEIDKGTRAELRLRKGVAFFRLGEQENCLATHNADSCVFPLKPKAYHLLPRGSRGAIAMFSAHLAEYPDDLSTRWLLNLAHMTLGEYPEPRSGPERYRQVGREQFHRLRLLRLHGQEPPIEQHRQECEHHRAGATAISRRCQC